MDVFVVVVVAAVFVAAAVVVARTSSFLKASFFLLMTHSLEKIISESSFFHFGPTPDSSIY